jgi:uncharacterized protein (TIGR02217 family)
MAFIESQFPPLISYHPTGGPGWNTTVNQVESGQEYRNQGWSQALRRYEISHSARSPSIASQIVSCFMVAQGRTNGFRLKDWADYTVAASEGVFVMLTSTTFQLYKRYTFGSVNHDRKITKPVASPAISVTGGTFASVDTTTGIVTMTAGTPTSWSGQFDVPVRFDVDELKSEIIDKSGGQFVVAFNAIPLVELRL